MELNFSEMNTMNPYDSFDYDSYQQTNRENYWEKSNPQETQKKKKKVSFNDILSNMNLVVNNQGVLQFMLPIKEESHIQQTSQNNNYNYNTNQFNQSNFNQSSFNQNQSNNINHLNNIKQTDQNKNTQPLDPSVKHSYIYNKYFKDYADTNVEKPTPRVPKTIEEYYQMLLDDKKNAIEHKLRMEQIKSKKLMFTAPEGVTGVNPRKIVSTKNNLRSMNFR
jgi:hypothetical protein